MRFFTILAILLVLCLFGSFWGVTAQDKEVTPTFSPVPDTYVSSVAWSPDGMMIAVGKGTDSCESDPNLYTIQILDAVTQEVIRSLSGSTCAITSIDWSPDGTKLAASSLDGIGTRVWDVLSSQLLMVKQPGGQGIASVK